MDWSIIGAGAWAVAGFIAHLFKMWGLIFVAPVYPRFEPDILWIIVPIWLNFIIAEMYQEKYGTSLGNAIQNGLVAALIGIDWMRFLTRSLTLGSIIIDHVLALKVALAFAVVAYGSYVVYSGLRGHKRTKTLGRIRRITYVLAAGTPLVYGLVPVSRDFFLAAILLYPIYHYSVEFLGDRVPTHVDYN